MSRALLPVNGRRRRERQGIRRRSRGHGRNTKLLVPGLPVWKRRGSYGPICLAFKLPAAGLRDLPSRSRPGPGRISTIRLPARGCRPAINLNASFQRWPPARVSPTWVGFLPAVPRRSSTMQAARRRPLIQSGGPPWPSGRPTRMAAVTRTRPDGRRSESRCATRSRRTGLATETAAT